MYLLTISVAVIRKRLDKYSSVLDIEERDKERIYKILRCIGKTSDGIIISDLKKRLGKGKDLNFSNTHLVAFMGWLRENGYLARQKGKTRRKLLFLPEKGRRALHELDDYLYSPETSLKIDWNLPVKVEVEASLKGNVQEIIKTAIFSREFIRNRILELSAALAFFPEDIFLNIKIPAMKHKEILVLLKILWGFYWQKVTASGVRPNIFGPIYVNMHLTDKRRKETYTEFWKKHLTTYLRFKGENMYEFEMFHGEKRWLKKGPLFPPLPRELEHSLPFSIENKEVRQWIESQLEKDADWFMPHYFWVELGFKRRREDLSVNSVDHVSPPYFHEIISPKLPREYGIFDSMIRHVVRKEGDQSIKALCNWLAKASNWRSRDFYKSWRILRREYREKIDEEPKFREIAKILDEAFREYIIAGHNPNVNLPAVFHDYLGSGDVKTVVCRIKDRKYRFAENAIKLASASQIIKLMLNII